MKKRLNEQLSVRSVLLILMSAVLVILISAIIAKATCTPASAVGCDVNCTVQINNECDPGFDCVARTCDRICGRPTCNPPRCIESICLGCVIGRCPGFRECCSGGAGC